MTTPSNTRLLRPLPERPTTIAELRQWLSVAIEACSTYDPDNPEWICIAIWNRALRMARTFKAHGPALLLDPPPAYDPDVPNPLSKKTIPILLAFIEWCDTQPRETPPDVPKQSPRPASDMRHADGPDGGCWLWWDGKRFDIKKGIVYRLIDCMWGRDSATFDAVKDFAFDIGAKDSTIRSYVTRANKALMQAGVPWRLSCNQAAMRVTKQPAKKSAAD